MANKRDNPKSQEQGLIGRVDLLLFAAAIRVKVRFFDVSVSDPSPTWWVLLTTGFVEWDQAGQPAPTIRTILQRTDQRRKGNCFASRYYS